MLGSSTLICCTFVLGFVGGLAEPPTPEAQAVAYLSREVPRWSRENHCYSCHNNGDAARALYRASRAGIDVPQKSLEETTRWLTRPSDWDHNGGDGPFSDKVLARVVFTTSLQTAVATKWIDDRSVLIRAAERLVLDQADDGSWSGEGDDGTGSPASYGRPLATWLARDSLSSADKRRFHAAIEKADGWLARQKIVTVAGASVALMATVKSTAAGGNDRSRQGLELLRRGQSDDGGWGPHVSSPPEPFDTAIALLALANAERSPEVRAMIARGRAFLVAQQQQDGSWIETTRPPGDVSYAQRISTTGWATLALLATRDLNR
jgi:Squalene-hopene cyclase C-terminal domain